MACFSDLSQELVDRIVCLFLDSLKENSSTTASYRQLLPSLATLSAKWQRAIERETFRELHLSSTCLEALENLVVDRRRSYVREIAVSFVLAPYDLDKCTTIESPEEQRRNNTFFTAMLQRLLQMLSSWEVNSAGLQLYLMKFASPSDILEMSQKEMDANGLKELSKVRETDHTRRSLEQRYEKSYLSLVDSFPLPRVGAITELRICAYWSRRMWPATAVYIAALLPNLQSFGANLSDFEVSDVQLWLQSRNDLAIALNYLPPSLHTLDLNLDYASPIDEHHTPPNLSPSPLLLSPLLPTLHRLSQTLTTLTLTGLLASPSLFWPPNATTAPSWPHLRHLTINFAITTSSGHWLFAPDPSMRGSIRGWDNSFDLSAPPGYTHYDTFRTVPVEPLMHELHAAVARAAARMPVLEVLFFMFNENRVRHHGFRFETVRSEGWEGGRHEGVVARAEYCGLPPLRPSAQLTGLWKKVAEGMGGALETRVHEWESRWGGAWLVVR